MFNRRVVFTVCFLGMLFFGITLIILGSLLPDLREKLGIGEITSGELFALLPLGILFGSLFFGPFCDRYGYRLLLTLSSVFISAGLVGIALSTTIVVLKICVFVLGFGGGVINGTTNALISDISDKNRIADLALLGSFFGLGALGMPLLIGLLDDHFRFEAIVSFTGLTILGAGLAFALVKYPDPRQPHGLPLAGVRNMLKDSLFLALSFFLFFQASFEGLFNNWTTTFILERMNVEQDKALFALSSYVAGMTIMRLLIGSLLRSFSASRILSWSFILILTGQVLLRFAFSISAALPGLVLTGAGLAAGFPIILGIAGDRYRDLPGTAFSLILVVGLVGNMTINYLMGIIAQVFGVHHITTIAFAELFALFMLGALIFKKVKRS